MKADPFWIIVKTFFFFQLYPFCLYFWLICFALFRTSSRLNKKNYRRTLLSKELLTCISVPGSDSSASLNLKELSHCCLFLFVVSSSKLNKKTSRMAGNLVLSFSTTCQFYDFLWNGKRLIIKLTLSFSCFLSLSEIALKLHSASCSFLCICALFKKQFKNVQTRQLLKGW